jgi:hypothetical protein
VSMSGLGFITTFPMAVGTILRCSLQFKRLRFDFGASIVRAFKETGDESLNNELPMNYGAELDAEDHGNMKRFIEQYIQSLPPERLKESLIKLALRKKALRCSHSSFLSLKTSPSLGTKKNLLRVCWKKSCAF